MYPCLDKNSPVLHKNILHKLRQIISETLPNYFTILDTKSGFLVDLTQERFSKVGQIISQTQTICLSNLDNGQTNVTEIDKILSRYQKHK